MPHHLTRHKMELKLDKPLPVPSLAEGYLWIPWDDDLLDAASEIHFLSFRGETDADLFASFRTRKGCHGLWEEVRYLQHFLPECNWLIGTADQLCATIQCVALSKTIGGIQNLAVLPAYRGQGLGKALVERALRVFQTLGLKSVTLEVTEENSPAFRLYQSLGFRKIATTYRPVA